MRRGLPVGPPAKNARWRKSKVERRRTRSVLRRRFTSVEEPAVQAGGGGGVEVVHWASLWSMHDAGQDRDRTNVLSISIYHEKIRKMISRITMLIMLTVFPNPGGNAFPN